MVGWGGFRANIRMHRQQLNRAIATAGPENIGVAERRRCVVFA